MPHKNSIIPKDYVSKMHINGLDGRVLKIRNSKFIEMPLQINTSITKKKIKQPYLSLEDNIFKNESFRNYEISLIDEKEEKKIKCFVDNVFRRFDKNFWGKKSLKNIPNKLKLV